MQNQVNNNQVPFQEQYQMQQQMMQKQRTPDTLAVEDAYKACIAEFTAEGAIKADSSRGFDLTSIQPQFIRERLNEVFGMFGWKLTGEFKEVGGGILFEGHLTVTVGEKSHSHLTIGFAKTGKNIGDTFKSAYTDALSKGASNYGIGNSVFKGLVAPPSKSGGGFKKPAPRKKAAPQQAQPVQQAQPQQAQPQAGANPFASSQAAAPQQAQQAQQEPMGTGQGVTPNSGGFVL